MTASIIALYKAPSDPERFEAYYFGTHAPLARKMPGLIKEEFHRLRGADAPFYLMAILTFNTREERDAALSSPEGQATAADVPNFAAPGSVTVALAESIEIVDPTAATGTRR
ncbi:MAG TPA: EthD family reductase [Ktedonobacteraceae bacterium]|nr:EthD family reductase [Ktedonobacteraceae bacterium]